MRSRQRGATLLGILTIVAILGVALFAAMRLVPVYLEYMAVARALDQTAKENSGGSMETLRTSLIRRWAVEDIKTIDAKDVQIVRANKGFTMRAWYRAEVPFVGNVSLVADFDKTVPVGDAGLPGT
ncbi:DUF4845 domain-containing protein [Steroidobacter sp.]|uniref:DUF4845 domain-containing protein n=1 Tax=Steroidobacter sp. TaxID=1978227 RepID=UPI001A506A8B|nr:DUF4845 domain-containing protein [Steroidobacter sp.]MBL8264882.1 DUF4845 domain-containing protein [Steroidobacter sp.]